MNHLLYAIPLFLLAAPVFAGETIRPNPFIDGQYDIFDDGKRVGTIRENPFIDGQLDRTLRGEGLVDEFVGILDDYVERRYGGIAGRVAMVTTGSA